VKPASGKGGHPAAWPDACDAGVVLASTSTPSTRARWGSIAALCERGRRRLFPAEIQVTRLDAAHAPGDCHLCRGTARRDRLMQRNEGRVVSPARWGHIGITNFEQRAHEEQTLNGAAQKPVDGTDAPALS